MKKFILLILSIPVLQGCVIFSSISPRSATDTELIEAFPNNKKSVIVYKQNNDSVFYNSSWQSINQKDINDKNYIYLEDTGRKKLKILVVNPGIYTFREVYNYNGSITLSDPLYDYEINNPKVASFEVKSGEVVYIGDFNISQATSKNIGDIFTNKISARFTIKVDDNFNQAKFFLEREYPQLSDMLVKRLIINRK